MAQMRPFAEAAVVHAAERHAVRLTFERAAFPAIDDILDDARQRLAGEPDALAAEQREMLALCYGSWLGEWALAEFDAEWVGLHEPEPPRLSVAGKLVSPIDAIRRRLTDPEAPPAAELAADLTAWSQAAISPPCAHEQNRVAWEALAGDPRFASSAAQIEQLPRNPEQALAAIDPWLTDSPLAGKELLCLAAGGGTHGPLHALAGARVTVVDLSPRMLAIDAAAAQRLALDIRLLEASLDDLSPLADAAFDLVLQPVSSCYLPDLAAAYAEVARVIRPGGRYVVQHKQPASLQAGAPLPSGGYELRVPAFAGRAPEAAGPHRESGATEFIHPLGALLGGLCQVGFVIEDVREPPRGDLWSAPGSRSHRACWTPPYLKIKARRV